MRGSGPVPHQGQGNEAGGAAHNHQPGGQGECEGGEEWGEEEKRGVEEREEESRWFPLFVYSLVHSSLCSLIRRYVHY